MPLNTKESSGKLSGKWDGDQLDYDDLMGKLKDNGLLNTYRERSQELRPSLFKDPYGIHGIAHAKRVLMLSLLLSFLNGLNQEDTYILVLASLFHDIGRTHNGKCYVHGRDSHTKMVRLGLLPDKDAGFLALLRYVLENHCIDDQLGFAHVDNYDVNKDRAIELLKLFKDCDNLDRVRLGDLDAKYLRNPYSPGLVAVAERLLREIE